MSLAARLSIASVLLITAVAACRTDRSQQPERLPVAPLPGPTGSATLASGPGVAELMTVPPAIAAKVTLREVVKGLRRPVLAVIAPGDARKRLFVLEQHAGTIRFVENGVLAPRPVLQLGGLATGNEQGLLGLAFHPKFAENGKLYVNYTSEDKATHIVEYRLAPSDPDRVDPRTARELVVIAQPYSNHNGGHLLFGPDGKLYTGMGDGGSANDPKGNGQNPKVLLGKILRIDVDAAKPAPEMHQALGRGLEIAHLGLRNPWRFWFDKPTGDLYIADVGQNLWESVFVISGADSRTHNFGWNVTEGNHCFQAESCDRSAFTAAAVDYPHDQGCSITGGVTYRGKALPDLIGHYFYADYCTGLVRSFRWTRDPSSPTAAGFVRDHWDWKAAIDKAGALNEISSFGVDHDGEVYIVLLTGSIYQLVPAT